MSRQKVLMTGISGRLGKLVARRLHRRFHVVGVDRRDFPEAPKDVELHRVDIRRKRSELVFERGPFDALVHMGLLHDPRRGSEEHHAFNVAGTKKVLQWCVRHDIPKVVVLSSANVYGPQPENESFLDEDTLLLASARFSGVRDLVAVDQMAQAFLWKQPEIQTVILRPVHIVGPNVRNAPSNYLRIERPMSVLGFDPMVQLIHEEDVVRGIELAITGDARGIFNLVGPGELPLSEVLRALGRRPISLPSPLARAAVHRMFRWHLTNFPAPELDHIQFSCTVDGSRAREALGFEARHSLQETIEAIRESPTL